MQPPEFWEKYMLGKYASGCTWHAIVPTMLMYIKGNVEITDEADTELCAAQAACALCALCSQTFLVGQCCLYAVRVTTAETDGQKCIGFTSAALCVQCICSLPEFHSVLPSNQAMRRYVLGRLDHIASTGRMQYGGRALWNSVADTFDQEHAVAMKKLGKAWGICACCDKPKPKERCSACNFAYYCNEECARAKWSSHKKVCATLQQRQSIFSRDFVHAFTEAT
jgi:hypothetical protein